MKRAKRQTKPRKSMQLATLVLHVTGKVSAMSCGTRRLWRRFKPAFYALNYGAGPQTMVNIFRSGGHRE